MAHLPSGFSYLRCNVGLLMLLLQRHNEYLRQNKQKAKDVSRFRPGFLSYSSPAAMFCPLPPVEGVFHWELSCASPLVSASLKKSIEAEQSVQLNNVYESVPIFQGKKDLRNWTWDFFLHSCSFGSWPHSSHMSHCNLYNWTPPLSSQCGDRIWHFLLLW